MPPDGPSRSTAVALAALLLLLPVAHPLLRPAVGVASHLLWIVHVFAAAISLYQLGRRGGVVLLLSPALILLGERLFGAGYGTAASWDTAVSLAGSVGLANVLVAGLALQARRTRRELAELATHDPLTDLPNRRQLDQLLGRCVLAAREQEDTFAVAYLDLNRFKRINDSYGHSVGDRVMRGIAERLAEAVRPPDDVIRIGGDEFVLLLRHVSGEEEALEEVRDVLQAVEEAPVRTPNHELTVTASAGLAVWSDRYEEPEALVRDADTALTEARERGYGEVALFEREMHEEVRRAVRVERGLRRALEEDQFELYFQPLVAAETGELRGAEALLRWRHPEHGLVSPGEFLPVVESTDLLYPLGQWVLERAWETARSWVLSGERSRPLVLAVNTSAGQYTHPPFAELARRVAEEASGSGLRLELEITEGALMSDAREIDRTMEELREAGVRFAVDDFGTGYSALRYLHQLPVDTLKIDRGFVCDAADPTCSDAIAETIVSLARELELETVAEGVETERQADRMREMGATYLQGYLFGRPAPADRFRASHLASAAAGGVVSG